VPPGTSRLRLTARATLDAAELDQVGEVLGRVLPQHRADLANQVLAS